MFKASARLSKEYLENRLADLKLLEDELNSESIEGFHRIGHQLSAQRAKFWLSRIRNHWPRDGESSIRRRRPVNGAKAGRKIPYLFDGGNLTHSMTCVSLGCLKVGKALENTSVFSLINLCQSCRMKMKHDQTKRGDPNSLTIPTAAADGAHRLRQFLVTSDQSASSAPEEIPVSARTRVTVRFSPDSFKMPKTTGVLLGPRISATVSSTDFPAISMGALEASF